MVSSHQSALGGQSRAGAPAASRVTALLGAVLELGARPPASLDPLIDATERAVGRYGIRRASMSDLAREMNVARTTLYRQVDSVDEALAYVGARAVYRFLDEWSEAMLTGDEWWDSFVNAVVRAVVVCTENPALRRLLDHEPEVLGEFMVEGGLENVTQRLAQAAQPMLVSAIDSGYIADVDSRLAGEHMARSIIGLMLCPPADDLRAAVEFMLTPLLVEFEDNGQG